MGNKLATKLVQLWLLGVHDTVLLIGRYYFFLTREVLSGFLVEDPHGAKLNHGFVAAVLVGSR